MKKIKTICLLILIFVSLSIKSQTIDASVYKSTPETEQMYTPYIMVKHGIFDVNTFASWKESNTMQFYKELWYYSKSFYVKHYVNDEGVTIDESIIDITRFDSVRDSIKEVFIPLKAAGFNDTIVLLPINKLIYKP